MSKKSPFEHAEADDSIGFLLWQVTAIWQRHIAAALRPHNLTQVQFTLLAGLLWLNRENPSVTQITLAKHAKLDPMMTSQVLRTLETKGLITRKPHPTDTRAKVLVLTKNGNEVVWSSIKDVESADTVFFSLLNSGRATFKKILKSIVKNRKNQEPPNMAS